MAALFTCSTAFADDAPAFPGAEGHGRYVTGGRGGKIVHVTNLNNSGTGSFRAAVSGSAKKIVVFDVGGVIPLASNITIGANTTILGQTAPAPGITLRYYTISTENSNNIIVRFIRFRRGQEKNVNDGADAATGRYSTGIIFDHCSFSWSIDEVASFYDNNNFTMQWCTLGESLNNAGHGKGAHGYGGIWGGKLVSFHHNLICHVNNRSPRFNGARYEWKGYTSNYEYSKYNWANEVQAENVDFRNCVIYNCGNGCYGGPGGGQINIVNNYYKTGPAATTSRVTQVTVGASGNAEGHPNLWTMTSRYFIDGNQMNNTANFNGWSNISYDSGTYTIDGEQWSPDPNHYNGENVTYKKNSAGTDCVRIRLDEPAPIGDITTHTASNAFDKVLTYAGASLHMDDVDARYFTEAKNGTATYSGSVTKKKGRIDLVSDVNGYTEENFPTGSREEGFDTDNDGMPDAWETANGLNPNDASDANTFTLDSKGWYTNIEVYANSLVEDIMKAGNADAESSVDEYYPAIASGIERTPNQLAGKIVYFTVDGRRLDAPKSGISIRKITFSNGQIVTDKVIKR
ncbi:MAG: pectate lyase [Prevotella sp.]|nr:pectate lyase [Prevotella sp.]